MSDKHVYKNTLYLYLRMFIMMLISLYSSRIVLSMLGSSDYGLFNVVGGFTAFFFFVSNSLSLATERFMAYAIGQHDGRMRKRVFSLSVWFFAMLSVLIFIVGLIVGIPFVKHQLNIPPGREEAAVYVYIFALLSAIFAFMRIPMNASVIAYERMGFYAWISIVESALKLLLLFFLCTVDYDKLILYAVMLMGMSLTITLVYAGYCHRQFHDYTYSGIFDKSLLKSMGRYTGWNLYGSLADMAILQGLSIVLNYFFGTIVNAAQAIADQIKAQVAGFVNNLNTASSPAITKHYAEGNMDRVVGLLFQISKLNYFLLLAVSVPIITVLPAILDVWLGKGAYPEKTVVLTRLVLINTLIDTLPGAVQSVVFASGNIRKYQLFVSGIKFVSIVSVCLVLSFCAVPEYAYLTLILFAFPRVFIQIKICCRLISLREARFYRYVVWYDVMTTAIVVVLILLTSRAVSSDGILSAVLLGALAAAETVAVLFLLGLNAGEKQSVRELMKKKLPFLR